MKTITFHCETVTPMFLAGADGQKPELRPPSIKGAMRFWWRAMNGHLSLVDLKKRESEIFGGGGTKATQSAFSIIADENNMKTADRAFVPHKSFMKQKAFIEGEKFSVKLVFKNEKYFEEISNLFILVSILGGFGKRVRRGMGSFKVISVDEKNNSMFTLPRGFNEIFNLLNKINNRFILKNNVISSMFKNPEKYPYIEQIELGKQDNNILKKISNTTHEVKEMDKCAYEVSLGHAFKGRFASPVYVSIIDKLTPIVTILFAEPDKNKHNFNRGLQTEFKNKIL